MHKCIFKKYSAGIIDQVDTLKWIAWFDSLSTEDRRELVNFVKNEREYKLWKTEGWDQKYNPELQEGAIKGLFGISKNMKPHPLPSILGNIGSSAITEMTNSEIQEIMKNINEQKRDENNE